MLILCLVGRGKKGRGRGTKAARRKSTEIAPVEKCIFGGNIFFSLGDEKQTLNFFTMF